MKWYHYLFCGLAGLYLLLSTFDRFFFTVNSLFFSIVSLLVWGCLAFVSIKTMPRKKDDRKIWNYVTIVATSLLVLLIIFRMFTK